VTRDRRTEDFEAVCTTLIDEGQGGGRCSEIIYRASVTSPASPSSLMQVSLQSAGKSYQIKRDLAVSKNPSDILYS